MLPRAKTAGLLTILLTLCLLCSSCANGGIPIHDEQPSFSLPPVGLQYAPPVGDAALEYTAETVLYLPMHDGSRLISFTEDVVFSVARPQAESLVLALLNHPGNGQASPVGGSIPLTIYGTNPVEVSRDVVTVNLAASALQLERKAYYLACQAITNTLTKLPGIHYVNFLVMDKPIGLDIAGALPSGAFSRSVGEDIGAVYDQLLSQRADRGSEFLNRRLSTTVTLYFPLADMDGLLPEARSVSFDNQTPSVMIMRLLEELSIGSQHFFNAPTVPLLRDMLLQEPALFDAPNGGGQIVSLQFAHNLDDALMAFGLTRAQSMASLCYTLCTFLPNVAGISVSIGGEMISDVYLGENTTRDFLLFPGGIQSRSVYAPFLLDLCTLYFADASGQKLISVERAVPYHQTTNPRTLLLELVKGPLSTDSTQNANPIMPPNVLQDSDVFGFSLQDDLLLVHFTQTFEELGRNTSPQEDRLLAYGLVNTLAAIPQIRRICFFVAGSLPTNFSGEIYWAGDFYPNIGLVQNQ